MPKPYTSRAEYYYGALTEGYSGDLPRPQSREDYYLLKLIEKMNQSQGQTVFTPKGTVQNVAALPSLSDATAGDIYNIKVDSKTTSDFVEGTGVTIKGGSNVYCVLDDNDQKKWDCLGTTYAVDYALDPSSGSPIANNAVCAAIDNVIDQLNPAFVERHKTVTFSPNTDDTLDGYIIGSFRFKTTGGTYTVILNFGETAQVKITVNDVQVGSTGAISGEVFAYYRTSHRVIYKWTTLANGAIGLDIGLDHHFVDDIGGEILIYDVLATISSDRDFDFVLYESPTGLEDTSSYEVTYTETPALSYYVDNLTIKCASAHSIRTINLDFAPVSNATAPREFIFSGTGAVGGNGLLPREGTFLLIAIDETGNEYRFLVTGSKLKNLDTIPANTHLYGSLSWVD